MIIINRYLSLYEIPSNSKDYLNLLLIWINILALTISLKVKTINNNKTNFQAKRIYYFFSKNSIILKIINIISHLIINFAFITVHIKQTLLIYKFLIIDITPFWSKYFDVICSSIENTLFQEQICSTKWYINFSENSWHSLFNTISFNILLIS